MTTICDLPLIQDRRPKLPERIRQAVLVQALHIDRVGDDITIRVVAKLDGERAAGDAIAAQGEPLHPPGRDAGGGDLLVHRDRTLGHRPIIDRERGVGGVGTVATQRTATSYVPEVRHVNVHVALLAPVPVV